MLKYKHSLRQVIPGAGELKSEGFRLRRRRDFQGRGHDHGRLVGVRVRGHVLNGQQSEPTCCSRSELHTKRAAEKGLKRFLTQPETLSSPVGAEHYLGKSGRGECRLAHAEQMPP